MREEKWAKLAEAGLAGPRCTDVEPTRRARAARCSSRRPGGAPPAATEPGFSVIGRVLGPGEEIWVRFCIFTQFGALFGDRQQRDYCAVLMSSRGDSAAKIFVLDGAAVLGAGALTALFGQLHEVKAAAPAHGANAHR